MAERNRPSPDWYRRKILAMPDHDYLIGPLLTTGEERVDPAPTALLAFGTLVRLERRSRRLTVVELAKALDVEELEIRNIEHDPAFLARPRTVVGISKFFDLPIKELKKLSGAVASNDKRFLNEATRFAAHSDDIGSLTEEEKQLLQSFLNFLRDG